MPSTRARADAEAAGTAAARAMGEEADAHALHAAAATGDLAALRPILVDASPTRLNRLVQFILDNDSTHGTALFAASVGGHTDCVSALISAGADVELGFDEGTPLMIACFAGHVDIVTALLAAGADVHKHVASSDDRRLRAAAIHWAMNFCHTDVVKILLAAGEDVNSLCTSPGIRPGTVEQHTPLGLLAVLWEASFLSDPSALDSCSYGRGLEPADFVQLVHRKRRELGFFLLRAGADIDYLFENQVGDDHHGPGPWRYVDDMPVEYRDYFKKLHAAGGFSAYALPRQYQLTTIKLLARGCGRLNLPTDVISIIQEFWAKKPQSA